MYRPLKEGSLPQTIHTDSSHNPAFTIYQMIQDIQDKFDQQFKTVTFRAIKSHREILIMFEEFFNQYGPDPDFMPASLLKYFTSYGSFPSLYSSHFSRCSKFFTEHSQLYILSTLMVRLKNTGIHNLEVKQYPINNTGFITYYSGLPLTFANFVYQDRSNNKSKLKRIPVLAQLHESHEEAIAEALCQPTFSLLFNHHTLCLLIKNPTIRKQAIKILGQYIIDECIAPNVLDEFMLPLYDFFNAEYFDDFLTRFTTEYKREYFQSITHEKLLNLLGVTPKEELKFITKHLADDVAHVFLTKYLIQKINMLAPSNSSGDENFDLILNDYYKFVETTPKKLTLLNILSPYHLTTREVQYIANKLKTLQLHPTENEECVTSNRYV